MLKEEENKINYNSFNILYFPFHKSLSYTPLFENINVIKYENIIPNLLFGAFSDGEPYFLDGKNPLLDKNFPLKVQEEPIFLEGEHENISNNLKKVFKNLGIKKTKTKNYKNFCVGGNHLLSYYLVEEASIRYKTKLSCLIFDAHHDLWNETPPGKKYTNGTWLRRAIENGYVDPKKTVILGVRSVYPRETAKFYKDNNILVMHNTAIQKMTLQSIVNQILEKLDKSMCYLSFDVDFFDPSQMGATLFPEYNGFDSKFLFEFLSYFTGKWSTAPINFVGYDIVEYYSELDNRAKTSGYLTATVLFWFLCYEYLNFTEKNKK